MRARTGIQKVVWLHICQEGGKWTPKEIAELFSMEQKKANTMLHNMATRTGQLKRYSLPEGSRFGVTPDCFVPAGVSMYEVQHASAAGGR